MAIANGMCVSFCNQPKAQFGYLSKVTRFAGGGIWLPQTTRESKAHFEFLASLGQLR